MKEDRLCGYDINGWRDFAVRNWTIGEDGEARFGDGWRNEAGTITGVVAVGGGSRIRWVGGAQAALAPHGRGGGWGEVGTAPRHDVVRLLSGEDDVSEALDAAVSGTAAGTAYSVFAINDCGSPNEELQERLIEAAGRLKHRRTLAVWRPVLAVLYALEHVDAVRSLAPDSRIAVISQTADGIDGQVLRLRSTHDRGENVMAPERRHAGRRLTRENGFAHRLQKLLEMNGLQASAPLSALPGSIGASAMGLDAGPSLVRSASDAWRIVEISESTDDAPLSLSSDHVGWLGDADLVLLETVAGGDAAEAPRRAVEAALSRDVIALPPDAVASGALVGARRLRAGLPVFLDFLPQISTIVTQDMKPAPYDLIDSSETLPAGKLYRSPRPARFAIPTGQQTISVYIRKETAEWPRKITVDLGRKMASETPVEVWVEQSPAAGRARILMRSTELGRDFLLDWDDAEELDEDWDTLLASLETPPPSIPNRLILECGTDAWYGVDGSGGLAEAMVQSEGVATPDWSLLAQQMSARPFGKYAVSSDGEVPDVIDAGDLARLQSLSRLATREFEERLGGRRGGNDALKFLTWQFRRCDSEVVEKLLDVLEGRTRTTMFDHHMSKVLLLQGLGRTASTEEQERRILDQLLGRPHGEWRWRWETACASFLLSRSDTAPLMLNRSDVDLMANVVLREFESELRSEYTKFNYAPFLMAGLLRFRLKEPYALIAGSDSVADKFRDAIRRTLRDFERRRPTEAFQRKAGTYGKILRQIDAELEGKGTNPDLLKDIYGAGS
ncbi:MAG: hypothetical protein RIE24_13710 [Silicimonas sp.]